ncbi:MAG TPA: hypothetical protein VFQ45_03195 [Longimicrobium sp.]|nr:hypothetical protein [Longimicrobium sp.]
MLCFHLRDPLRAAACLGLLLAGSVLRASAQPTLPALEPGQRIRVAAPGMGLPRPTPAEVAVATPDSLFLTVGGLPLNLNAASVTVLQVEAGRRSRAGVALRRGLLLGAVGLAGGVALWENAPAPERRRQRYRCESPTGYCIRYYMDGPTDLRAPLTGAGVLAGVVWAWVDPGDAWRRVPLRGGTGPAASGGGLELGVVLRF